MSRLLTSSSLSDKFQGARDAWIVGVVWHRAPFRYRETRICAVQFVFYNRSQLRVAGRFWRDDEHRVPVEMIQQEQYTVGCIRHQITDVDKDGGACWTFTFEADQTIRLKSHLIRFVYWTLDINFKAL